MKLRTRIGCLAWLLLGINAAARAQALEEGEPSRVPRPWDAAIGAVAQYGPRYAGSDRFAAGVQPGLYLRWGRVSLATRSAFATRSGEGAPRAGLRVELADSARWRASLGLRLASGRSESADPSLRGLGDVRGTVRLRVSASYRIDDAWRVALGWSADLLGRDVGWLADASVAREQRLSDAMRWSWGAGVNFAGSRYQQAFFGITPEQSQRSGYAVYRPGAGWRDVGLFVGGRTDLSPHWFVFGNAGVSTLIGPPSRSPIVRQRHGWGVGAGLAYRF